MLTLDRFAEATTGVMKGNIAYSIRLSQAVGQETDT